LPTATVSFDALYDYADKVVREFDVRTPSIALPAQNLSAATSRR